MIDDEVEKYRLNKENQLPITDQDFLVDVYQYSQQLALKMVERGVTAVTYKV